MSYKYSIESLKTLVRLNLDENLNFDKVLSYIELIKNYSHLTTKPYYCEWLDSIEITEMDMNEEEKNENLPAGLKIGNISTYNYKKVPRVM